MADKRASKLLVRKPLPLPSAIQNNPPPIPRRHAEKSGSLPPPRPPAYASGSGTLPRAVASRSVLPPHSPFNPPPIPRRHAEESDSLPPPRPPAYASGSGTLPRAVASRIVLPPHSPFNPPPIPRRHAKKSGSLPPPLPPAHASGSGTLPRAVASRSVLPPHSPLHPPPIPSRGSIQSPAPPRDIESRSPSPPPPPRRHGMKSPTLPKDMASRSPTPPPPPPRRGLQSPTPPKDMASKSPTLPPPPSRRGLKSSTPLKDMASKSPTLPPPPSRRGLQSPSLPRDMSSRSPTPPPLPRRHGLHSPTPPTDMILTLPRSPTPPRSPIESPPLSPAYAPPLRLPSLQPTCAPQSYTSPGNVVTDDQPPPIPSTPRPFIDGFSNSNHSGNPSVHVCQQEQLMNEEVLSEEESEGLTLSQLVSKYSNLFPLRVKVVKGFYTDRVEVTSEEVYNIHFLKRAMVVTIRGKYDEKYVIPMNSAVQFGLIYNPADENSSFMTAGDLIAAPTLPNVVFAEKAYRGDDQMSSVDAKEVMILQGVHKTRFGHVVLKAYSITKKEGKTLTQDCIGQFTTNPYSTRLHLPEIMKHINNPLKLKARMFWDYESENLPSHLISDVITIWDQMTESSLIATQFFPDESVDEILSSVPDESELTEVVDIPLDLDIEVVVISSPESETDQLYMDTRELYQTFDPSRIKTLMTSQDTPTGDMQSQLYTAVREGHETEGLDLEIPTMAYDSYHNKDQPVGSSSEEDEDVDSDEYEIIDSDVHQNWRTTRAKKNVHYNHHTLTKPRAT